MYPNFPALSWRPGLATLYLIVSLISGTHLQSESTIIPKQNVLIPVSPTPSSGLIDHDTGGGSVGDINLSTRSAKFVGCKSSEITTIKEAYKRKFYYRYDHD